MQSTKCLKLFIYPVSLLMSTSLCIATPLIDEEIVWGEHASSVVVKGSGFGIKPTAAPLLFDQFEDNGVTNGTSLFDAGDYGKDVDADVTYQDINQRTLYSKFNIINKMVAGSKNGRFNRLIFDTVPGKKFISFWCYVKYVRILVTGDWGMKIWRLESGPKHGDYPSLAFQGMNTTNLVAKDYHYETQGTDAGTQWGYTYPAGQWFYMQIEVEDSSSIDLKDGGFITTEMWDGYRKRNIITNVATRTSGFPGVFQYIKFGYYLTLGVIPGHEVHTTWDDIYADNSWARVEIGDNAVYDQCTHREMQIPTSWSPDAIKIDVNNGSFNEGDTAYLYVFDPEGNISSDGQGVAITIGGGGSITSSSPPDLPLDFKKF